YQSTTAVAAPVFQVAIVDVETGLVVATAVSACDETPDVIDGAGVVECVFDRLPLRRRQYVLRLSITDTHQLMAYDDVPAGPRFAVVAGSSAATGAASTDRDGLVDIPFRFVHRVPAGAAGVTER